MGWFAPLLPLRSRGTSSATSLRSVRIVLRP